MKRDYKISIIRILAMLSIVACHIFQAQNMDIAFWLNVGVQVFLFMSGFLYGQKTITDKWEWMKKQFKKILVPYYIYVFFIIIIYLIFTRQSLTENNIESMLFGLQLVFPLPRGLGHFWFIPVILICYLITPMLQKLLKDKEKLGVKEIASLLGILLFIETLFLQTSINGSICNMICYVMGYFIACLLSYNYIKAKNIISIFIIIFALIFNFIKVSVVPEGYNTLIKGILQMIIANSHIFLGSAISIILCKILECVEKFIKPSIARIIDIIDKHSFYIYITHHVFILGPIAIINLTPNLELNIAIIICCTIISSYILGKLTDLVKKGAKNI